MGFNNSLRKKAYDAWFGILRRRDGKIQAKARYVDPEWEQSFDCFVSELGLPKSKGQVLCLRDPEAGFYPGNVYWGKRRDVQQYVDHANLIFFNGRKTTISEASRCLGITRASLRQRIQQAELNKAIGLHVQKVRTKAGESIASLARRTQIKIDELFEIERGDITAGKFRLVKIADALGVSYESLKSPPKNNEPISVRFARRFASA